MQNQSPTFVKTLTQWFTRLVEGLRSLPSLPHRLVTGIIDLVLTFSSLVVVVLKRMRHNLGISISAMLGVVAVLIIVVGVPIFSYSISSEVLVDQLIEKSNISRLGLFSLHMYYMDNSKASPMTLSTVKSIEEYLMDATPRLLDLKTEQVLAEAQTRVISWYPDQILVSTSAKMSRGSKCV